MTREELKPCPFCGCTPDADNLNTFQCDQGTKWGYVCCCCRGPEVRTGYGPVETWRDAAIEEWNCRAALAPPAASEDQRIADLRDEVKSCHAEIERLTRERDEALETRDSETRRAGSNWEMYAHQKREAESLRADNERLREALREITKLYSDDHNVHGNTNKAPAIARRALGEGETP